MAILRGLTTGAVRQREPLYTYVTLTGHRVWRPEPVDKESTTYHTLTCSLSFKKGENT